jgi:hypothetical protein
MLFVEFDIPVQNPNGTASETFGFNANGTVSRSLKSGSLIATKQDGDIQHKVTVIYERLESDADTAEGPALVPYKAYKLTIEEVQP